MQIMETINYALHPIKNQFQIEIIFFINQVSQTASLYSIKYDFTILYKLNVL